MAQADLAKTLMDATPRLEGLSQMANSLRRWCDPHERRRA
jgi:hypothetical protein